MCINGNNIIKNMKYCSTKVSDREFRKKKNDFLYQCKKYAYVLKLFKLTGGCNECVFYRWGGHYMEVEWFLS